MTRQVLGGLVVPLNTGTHLDPMFQELYDGVTVADGAVAHKWKAATGRIRLRPYIDATLGAALDSTNTAESSYSPLSFYASTFRFNNNSGFVFQMDAGGNCGLVAAASGTRSLDFLNASLTMIQQIKYDDADGSVTVGGGGSNYAVRFRVGTTTVMRMHTTFDVFTRLNTAPPTIPTNGEMVMNLTSNTNLRISVRGSDGVTRVANITLA